MKPKQVGSTAVLISEIVYVMISGEFFDDVRNRTALRRNL